ETGSHGAEPEVGVDVTWQHRQGNADVQVTDEREQNNGNDLKRDGDRTGCSGA
nr:hypothetical protein [Tanacetum cinerariifolium]